MTISAPTRDQTLWLLTAHPDTWELGDAPDWLVVECIEQGLAAPAGKPGVWKKTARANELLQQRLK